MENQNVIYDFFISHSKDEVDEAKKLYDMLKEINPEWNVFYDRECLQTEERWLNVMLNAVVNSKYLIFLAKTPDILEEGKSWVFREVQTFYSKNSSRFSDGNEQFCISYFGIIYGWNIKNELNVNTENAGLYHSMYKIPNNMILGKNESVSDVRKYLRAKVKNMVDRGINATPEYFLDKTSIYQKRKEESDINFKKERIVDEIIPTFYKEKSKEIISFELLLGEIEKNDTIIIGAEGGSGKTTVMTKLYYHYLEKALEDNNEYLQVPLYVEASSLAGENNIIKRYLARYLFDDNTATTVTSTETANIIKIIDTAFREKTETPGYILLIDGYNEIAEGVIDKFKGEIEELFGANGIKNVRIIISGRNVDEDIDKDRFSRISINKISSEKIKRYLKKNNYNKDISEELLKILSVPMYLTMFVNTSMENKINTRSELLMSFLERQILKDSASAQDKNEEAFFKFSLKVFLPYIAYRLCTKASSESNFVLNEDDLYKILYDALDNWDSREFRRNSSPEIRELFRLSVDNMKDDNVLWNAMSYYTKVSKLMVKKDENDENYEFIHQVYRDFFAALYIFEDIKISAEKDIECRALENDIREKDVISLASEMLCEGKPHFDYDENKWDYSCNENSRLIKLIENSRSNGQNENPVFVKGVTELLKRVRGNDLSGLDFSELDLTKTNLTSMILTRFVESGFYPTSFKNAKLNEENILISNPSNHIMAACTNEENVAVFESGGKSNAGVLKIWKKGVFDNNPKKTVTGITFKLHKLIFSQDNKKIYGMSGHTIVEIDVSLDEKFGEGQKIIFSGNHKLSDIFMGDDGVLYYTTVLNSFNPKPVPTGEDYVEIPDEIKFYGVNSAACVRKDKKQLAFGHITGYDGIKIYNLNEKTGEWIEQKIGIAFLIDEYVTKLEKAFKYANLYEKFYDENEYKCKDYYKKDIKFRCAFFKDIVFRYNSERSGYHEIPGRIYKWININIERKKLKLSQKVSKNLERIYRNYTKQFETYEKENRILSYLSGRKISSLEYKKDSDTLLVTYYNEYEKPVKKRYKGYEIQNEGNGEPVKQKTRRVCHATVAEINLSDLSTKLIHIYNGNNVLRSLYSGEDAVIYCSNKIWIADKMERFYCFPVIYMPIPVFFKSEKLSSLYMTVGGYVYEMDEAFTPKKSFCLPFRSNSYALILGEDGTPYIADCEDAVKLWEVQDAPIEVFNLKKGIYELLTDRGELVYGCTFVEDYYGKKLTSQSGRVNIYKDNSLEYCFEAERNMCLAGCDFTGVSGDVAIPENLDVLTRYGGITGVEKRFVSPPVKELDFSFTVSDKPFEESEELKGTSSMYVCKEGEAYTLDTKNYVGTFNSEIWDKIHFASYSRTGFEPSDFSILENLYYFKFLTPEMVYYLMSAGIIEKPSIYIYSPEKVKNRMKNTLSGTLKLVDKHNCEGSGKPVIYTYSNQYGKELLSRLTGASYLENRTHNELQKNIEKALLLNLWFSYTLMKYKDYITKFDAEVKFESKYTYIMQSEVVRRYIKLNEQAFILRLVRGELTEEKIEKNKQRILEFSEICENYPYLLNKGIEEGLTKPPVIVIIGENFDYCKKLDEHFKDITPHIRKIYTYDNLLNYGIKNDCEDIYFEFKDSKPYALSLRDLI